MRRLISVLILLMILAMPVVIMADTKSYSIDKLVENAVINEAGDIEIYEEFTYSFKGDFNGIYRNLLKNGAGGFTLLEVAERDSKGNVTAITKGGNSQNNTYELTEDSSAWKIKLFSKSNNEVKTFIFRYIMHGAAVKTEASGELYWSFYSVENNNTVGNIELNVALKNADFNMDKFKYWSYVEVKDFTTNYDAKGLHIKGKELTSTLGIRVLFQPEYLKIPVTVKSDNSSNLEKYRNQNNYNNYSSQYNINSRDRGNLSSIFIFAIVAIIVGGLINYFYQKNKKFKDSLSLYRAQNIRLNHEIYTTPPSDSPPVLVNFLVYESNLSLSMIPATLFYLSKKGYYILEKKNYEKSGFFKSVQEEDLAFKRNHQLAMPESPHLQYFMNWFSLYEDRGCFTLKGIEEKVSNRRGALAFKDQFSTWESIIREECFDLGFYTNIQGRQVLTNIYYNEQQKWLAYKKYLLDQLNNSTSGTVLGNLDDALIYAQALEIDSDQLESLSRKLNSHSTYDGDPYHHNLYNNNLYSHNMYNFYPFFFMNLHMWDNINNNINHNSGGSNSGGSNGFNGGDGGSFGGFSDGGGFSGGGGGDSGAF